MKQGLDVLEMEHAIGYSGKIPKSVLLLPNGYEYICISGASLIITDIRDSHKQSFLQGHDDQITCLAVSNQGDLIASGQRGDNSDVIIWDYHGKCQKFRLSEHDYEVSCVEFSHDDRLLFSCGNPMDKRIFIWDCSSGFIVGSVNHCPEPTALARWGGYAKDIKGRDTIKYQFATTGNKQICLWKLDPKSGIFEKEIVNTGNLVRDYVCMEFSKNREEYLFLGTTSGDFCAFQMKNKFFSHHIVVAALGVLSIKFIDFTKFLVGTGNGTLAQYYINEDNKITQTNKIELAGAVNSISVFRDLKESLVATDRGLIYRIQSDSLQKILHSENHTGSILELNYSPQVSDRFASASEDGTIRIWDISEYQVLARCQANVTTVPLSLVYRDEVLLSGWADGKIRMFRSDNGQQIWQIDNAHKSGVTTICVSFNLKFFCSGGGEGDVRIWEMRTREMVSHLKEHTHKVTKVQLTARETQLLSSSRDRALLQWDLKSEKRVSAHIQRMGGINSFDTIPNTTIVITTGQDRKITQWDLNAVEAIRQFDTSINPKRGDECYSICLSHNYRYAVTGGTNCSVKLWDMQNGQLISEGFGHSGSVNSVQFSADDKQVISGGADGVIIVWNYNNESIENFQLPNAEDFQADYHFNEAILLGTGSFGKVYKARKQKGTEMHAVKIVETINEETYNQAQKELQLNRLINIHPNVIFIEKVYAWAEKSPVTRFVLVFSMKLAEGSLKDLVQKQKVQGTHFEDKLFLDLADQLLTAFEYLMSSKGLYHRDIKPENILYETVNGKLVARITDFGVSKALQNLQMEKLAILKNTLVGTPLYLSPKLWEAYLNGQSQNVKHNLEKSDVFSLGVTLLQTYLMLTDQDVSGINDQNKQNALKLLPQIKNEKIKLLLTGMLEFQEKQRFTWTQALMILHPEQVVQLNKNSNNEEKYLVPIQYEKTFQSNSTKIKLRMIGQFYHGSDNLNFIGQHLCGDQIASFTNDQILVHDFDGNLKFQKKIDKIRQLCYIESTNTMIALINNDLYLINAIDDQIILKQELQQQQKVEVYIYINQYLIYLKNQLIAVGHFDGQITIIQLIDHMAKIIKTFQDHTSTITCMHYCSDEEFLVVSDKSKIISVRNGNAMQINIEIRAFQKLDYILQYIQRINPTLLAVNGQDQIEILLIKIVKLKQTLKLEIQSAIQLHSGIPKSIAMIDSKCLIVSNDSDVVLYDISKLGSELGHLILKDIPLLFLQLFWQQNLGYLIVSDQQRITKWKIEYDQLILGGTLQMAKKSKSCCCCKCNLI